MQSFHSRDYIHFLETHSNQSDSGDEEEMEDMDTYGLGERVARPVSSTHPSQGFIQNFSLGGGGHITKFRC